MILRPERAEGIPVPLQGAQSLVVNPSPRALPWAGIRRRFQRRNTWVCMSLEVFTASRVDFNRMKRKQQSQLRRIAMPTFADLARSSTNYNSQITIHYST
jgi:hypothetical protein